MSVMIIGAGPAGLCAAKAALECGLQPTVLEKEEQVGGLWKPQTGSVWDNMRTNLSHHSCMFSDMPWETPTEDFPNQTEVCDYLRQYATQNEIMKHIHFNAEVKKVSASKEKWQVEWLKNKELHQKEFDYVIVCSGIFNKPYMPTLKGLDTFTGQVLHSKNYKNPLAFKDKKVVVIGNSFSGTEIAAEVSTQAKQTIHSASKAMWVLPRYLPFNEAKRPLDLIFYSRAATERSKGILPEEKNKRTYQWFQGLTKQEKVVPELAVTAAPTDPSYVAISDTYIDQVRNSKIEIKPSRICEISEDTIIFEDKTSLAVDALIFATGYEASLPFFDSTLLEALEFCAKDRFQPLLLDKCTFNPHLPNMAFVGMYRGPYFATIELQARLACYVFSQKVQGPTLSQMEEGMEIERKIRTQTPRPQFPHGDYVAFADNLAKAAGVLPDFEALQATDADLYKKIWEGPLNASHYRLNGYAANPKLAHDVINRL